MSPEDRINNQIDSARALEKKVKQMPFNKRAITPIELTPRALADLEKRVRVWIREEIARERMGR